MSTPVADVTARRLLARVARWQVDGRLQLVHRDDTRAVEESAEAPVTREEPVGEAGAA